MEYNLALFGLTSPNLFGLGSRKFLKGIKTYFSTVNQIREILSLFLSRKSDDIFARAR